MRNTSDNTKCYLWGVFCGSMTIVLINYLNSYSSDCCDGLDEYLHCPYNANYNNNPDAELYRKIIQSESAYGDALKRNDKDCMNRAFNTSTYYQRQLSNNY